MAQKKAHEVDLFLAHPSQLYPVILLYGPDEGLVFERAQRFIKNNNLDKDDPFSTTRLEAAECERDPGRLLDEVNSISFLSDKRLIWIKNAATQKGLTTAIKSILSETLEKTFILIEAGDLKKNAILRTMIEQAKNAMALPCYSDDASAIHELIQQILNEFSLTITMDAREKLCASLGSNRLSSRQEIEKLCFYVSGKTTITFNDVLSCVSDVSTLAQDDIIDAILAGDILALNNDFDRHVASGTALSLILSAVQRQFQQLQEFRFILDRGKQNAAQIVAMARPPIFFRRRKLVETALLRWNSETLLHAMKRLQHTTVESRKNTRLATAIVRQNLIALALETIRGARKVSR